jgi:hypothetical protein
LRIRAALAGRTDCLSIKIIGGMNSNRNKHRNLNHGATRFMIFRYPSSDSLMSMNSQQLLHPQLTARFWTAMIFESALANIKILVHQMAWMHTLDDCL